MAEREVRIGLIAYQRADIPEITGWGRLGDKVDVHADDVARFDSLNGSAEAAETVESEGVAPAGNASLEDWQEFARSQGATDDDLEGKTRNDLRAEYGA